MPTETLSGFKLSPQQQRLWFLQQTSTAYRSECALLLEGNLAPAHLRTAVQRCVDRHDILRSHFRRLPGLKIPVMMIADALLPLWQDVDLTDWTAEAQATKIIALFHAARSQPEDLEQGSLFRLALLKLSPTRHLLILSLPALCADAKTLQNLAQELSQGYGASFTGATVSDEGVQYVQFSEWQHQLLTEADAQTGQAYWRRQLSTLEALKLPFETKPESELGFEVNDLTLAIAPHLTAQLETLAHNTGTSVAVVLLACWQTLLWRLTGQSTIIVGNACDRRVYEELHDALGLFATWLPIGCQFTPDLRFTELLNLGSQTLGSAEEWQDYFDWEQSGVSPDPRCFAFGFEFESWPTSWVADGVSFSLYHHYTCIEQFKVKLTCTRHQDDLKAVFYYDAHCFSADAIQTLAHQFQRLLRGAIAHPDTAISTLELLSPTERQQLLVAFNQTQTHPADPRCIHEQFEWQAEHHPTAIAVVYEDQQLTYAELNHRANQLAHYLQQLGAKPEQVIGMYLERSLTLIVALLGVLKAGSAYLPLDPALPAAALANRLQIAQTSLLLTQQSLANAIPPLTPNVRTINLDSDWATIEQESAANPICTVEPEHLMYVLFTSGSTGQPKGVAIEHRQLQNYLSGILEKVNLPMGSSFATVSTLAADLGNTAIFSALCTGGCLHLISPARLSDPKALAEYFEQHPIDCLKIVPSHLSALLNTLQPAQLLPRQCLILGGEASPWAFIEQLQQLGSDCQILNHYGPTETTVGSLTYRVQAKPILAAETTVPLGQPLANTQVYVLDQHLQPVPIGVPGELYIGGAGLARCYLHRPDLTAERFIPHPFSDQPGMRLYKTGDEVRYLPDGTLLFLGRTDHQVKVRGYRVELGEIETVLTQHLEVRQAVVSVRAEYPDDQRLTAYVVPNRFQAIESIELRQFLRERLPEYMVPSRFVILKALPLTPNGKVDRQALPAPEDPHSELAATYALPCTETEQAIAQIWQEALRIETVGLHDNFFDIGGHSLLMVQVHSKLRARFDHPVSIGDLFKYPTISTLVQYFSQVQPEAPLAQRSLDRAQTRRAITHQRRQNRQGNHSPEGHNA